MKIDGRSLVSLFSEEQEHLALTTKIANWRDGAQLLRRARMAKRRLDGEYITHIYSLLWHLENEGWIYIKKMWERKRGKEAGKDRGGWDRRRTVQRFWPFLLCRKAGRCGREASVGQAGLGRDSSNLILFYFSNCPRLLPHLTTSAPHSTNLY